MLQIKSDMTLAEFRKKISDSGNSEVLNNVTTHITYPHIDFDMEFKGLASIYQFVLGQVKGWNKFEDIPDVLLGSKKHFENLKDHFINLSNYLSQVDEYNYTSIWDQLNRLLKANASSYNGQRVFLHEVPEVEFLQKLYLSDDNNSVQGAYDYILKSTNTIDYNYLKGLVKAYEFENQSSELNQRRQAEKISLGRLRQKFEEHIGEAETHLNDYLSRSQQSLVTHFEENDKLKEDNNNEYRDWFNNIVREYEEFFEKSQSNMDDYEDTYRLKLKLEAPAQYWKDRANKLKQEGKNWAITLFAAVFIGALSLFILLWQIPDGMFLKLFKGEASAIKWTIVYVTFISFIAYSIKILAKLTFSTFHLSRDSEEREQLSYFYLALKKDSNITDEERQLVLQSLFSRSDTGLLKEDSSPTMPSNIVEKHLGNK